MTSALLLALALAAPQVTLEMSPDQAMPFVYLDEPLLIELQSDRDVSVRATLTVQVSPQHEAWTAPERDIVLRENSPYWCVYEDLPTERGQYAALFRMSYGDKEEELRAYYTRMDRPYTGAPQAFTLHLNDSHEKAMHLMRHVGAPYARMDIDNPELETALSTATEYGVKLAVLADGEDLDALSARVNALSQSHCAQIARWEMVGRGETVRLQRLSEAVRAANCMAPVHVILRSDEELRLFMQDGSHTIARGIIAQGESLHYGTLLQWNELIQEGGYESFPLESANLSPISPVGVQMDRALLHRSLMQRIAGANKTGLDGQWLLREIPGELLAYLNGLAPQLEGLEAFGAMVLSADLSVPVFRKGQNWCVALWREQGSEKAFLPVGDAQNLRVTDAFNNPRPSPTRRDETLEIAVAQDILLLWGEGGTLFAHCARNHAAHLARRFSDNEKFQAFMPASMMELVAEIAKDPGGLESRTHFFQLIRFFPDLEAQWHAGLLPRPVAVPAIAQLAALSRRLCTLEEARGEPILEPMNDMLARAREMQSLYLTGTVGIEQPYRRGDWLLEEVKRLNEEAEELSESGARIEAAAVAALCEWRARALEFAAKAGPQSMLSSIGPVAQNAE